MREVIRAAAGWLVKWDPSNSAAVVTPKLAHR